MRLGARACGVADFHDKHLVADDPVAKQIGRDHRDLPTASRYREATIRIGSEAFAKGQKLLAQTLSGEGLRLANDVGYDGLDVGKSAVGPNYFRHEYGVGSWLGVPKDFNQSRTRSCGTTRPAAISASASASASSSASSSNSSKMSGSGSAMPYDSRNFPRTNREKPSFWSAS